MGNNSKPKLGERARAEVETRVEAGIRENIVDVYEDLFETIWDKITPTLGVITTRTIIDRAIRRTTEQHELVGLITVGQEGLDFSALRAKAADRDREELKDGFKNMVANLLDILAKLTGNVLVNELLKVTEGKA